MSYHFFSHPDGCHLSKPDGQRNEGYLSPVSNHWSFALLDYLLDVTNIKNALSENGFKKCNILFYLATTWENLAPSQKGCRASSTS